MRERMTPEQFRHQVRCLSEMSEQEAIAQQSLREELGQMAVIYLFPIQSPLEPGTFWTDIHGKAEVTDGIGPIFREMNGMTVRGIALWRSATESCYTT